MQVLMLIECLSGVSWVVRLVEREFVGIFGMLF